MNRLQLMIRFFQKTKILKAFVLLAVFSCEGDEDEKPNLRPSIDYGTLTPATPYSSVFVDVDGNTTVDLTEGNTLLKMFQALNYYAVSSVSAGTAADEMVLSNMFSNTGDPFMDISTSEIDVSGAALNSSGLMLRRAVAQSLEEADAEIVREEFETYFTAMDVASQSLGSTASPGQAGKLADHLVDSRGLEVAQIIQNSLIGALQLDYMGNILLDEGLAADNTQLADNANYTQLEHNWDIAYGLLTLNPVYLEGATDASRNTTEFGGGAIIWEYNKAGYSAIYPAFLKGRAAIVNSDVEQYEALATLIRLEFEKSIANGALVNLEKWKTARDDAGRAHAIGNAVGFIYSLRFAELHQIDATYSETILENLIGSGGGFWDVDAAKVNAAIAAIQPKFQ